MPSVYLSPSTQEYNQYYDGSGSEEYYMNLIADYMEPYLISSGVDVARNSPQMTAGQSASNSNQGSYGLHLAIHSNAAGIGNTGNMKGTDVYYYSTSVKGKQAADIIVNNFKKIYPYPNLVRAVPNTTFVELKRTKAPAVLIEIAYHDNKEDAEWIKNNLEPIAENLALSVCEFLGVPFQSGSGFVTGIVNTNGSRLNLRAAPSLDATIIGKMPDKSKITVISDNGEWMEVEFNGKRGFAYAKYIKI